MQDNIKIDLKDRKIIFELDQNARISLGELAKKIRLSHQTTQYRIERLKRRGILTVPLTVFDSAVVGKRWFRVVAQLQRITTQEKEEFIESMKRHPTVVWFGEVGGNWDFVINFVASDQFEFNAIFEAILGRWGAYIQRYEVLTYISVRDQSRRYLLNTEKRAYWDHIMKTNEMAKLDGLDKKIINLLALNGSRSVTEMGVRLKVNYKTIQNRMRELEKNNVILGYRYYINPAKIGYEGHMLFLGIQTYKPAVEKQLYEFLKHPNVTFVVKHLGRWRIGMEIEVKNRNEFQEFLIDLRTRFGEIISEYETFPIFRDHVINYFPVGALEE